MSSIAPIEADKIEYGQVDICGHRDTCAAGYGSFVRIGCLDRSILRIELDSLIKGCSFHKFFPLRDS
jgi:hypothetical protein